MAHIGMKNPVAAKWAEGNKYTEGFVVAKAINFTVHRIKTKLSFLQMME